MIRTRVRRLETLLSRLRAAIQGRTAPPPRRLQTAGDVIALLQEQVEAIRTESCAGTLEKARVIGYLAGIARKAIETNDLAVRVEMLEAVLKQRKENNGR
jgi:hypothetical protein